jgi:hypothetical protein
MAPFGTARIVARFIVKGKPDPARKSRIFNRLRYTRRGRIGVRSASAAAARAVDLPLFVLVE